MSGKPTDRLARLRVIARWLDESIRVPGTRFRIGFDAIIGLVPGLGDVASTAVSGYILLEAARIGADGATLLRMLTNVGLDALLGTLPVVGDLFDAAFKANTRNLRLLEAATSEPVRTRQRSRLAVAAVLAGLLGVMAMTFFLLVWLVWIVSR